MRKSCWKGCATILALWGLAIAGCHEHGTRDAAPHDPIAETGEVGWEGPIPAAGAVRMERGLPEDREETVETSWGATFSSVTTIADAPRQNCGGTVDWWYAKSIADLHETFLKQLALRNGEPIGDGLLLHYANAVELDGGSWGLEEAGIELVALGDHDEAVVFSGLWDPHGDGRDTAPMRKLDRFEQQALKRVTNGEAVVWANTGTYVRMMGGIPAERTCPECHEAPEGTLLGAYAYRLTEIPDD